ncbi:MAG: RNA-binding cell elongation regulator Jag/EloR [Candidatus Ornithomonoglobus sp.]
MSQFPKTNASSIEKRAKSVDDAVAEALAELGIKKDDAVIEIIQEPSKGFLGLGAKEAIVKVSTKDKAEPVKAAPAPKAESARTEVKPAPTAEAPEEPEVKAEAETVKAVNRVYSSESPVENAKSFITSILTAMGLDVKVDAVLEDDIVKINLEGENMGIVIGKRGDTLDSLQYLTSLVVNQSSENYIKVSIDTENYRAKRAETLIALSNKLAERVARTRKKYPLEEMNPYERRIIHANLQDNEEVTTYSVGQEPHRKVVIAPKNPKPYNNKRGGGYNKNRGGKRQGSGRGGYSRQGYAKPEKKSSEASAASSATYKADFKPTPHKPEYKDFAEYLAAQSKN